MEKKSQTKYHYSGVPQSITILDKKYSFKDNLKDKKHFVYRCIHRNCKAQITIDKENILKALMKKDSTEFQYKIWKNSHSCTDKAEEKKNRS